MNARKEHHTFESSLVKPLHQLETINKFSKYSWFGILSVAACVASFFLPVSALAVPVMTRFNPKEHGFKFKNNFKNVFISELNWTTSGLCGGMAYSALDYFNNRTRIPHQDFMPAEGTTLQSYIYNRRVNSIEGNLDKWAEYGFNPGGARNREFFSWGLQFGNGRLGELRQRIDQGQPVPLGLQSCGSDCGCPGGCPGSHQVLAIGYDLGRYKGNLNANSEDVSIFVYDPNYPNQILTLKPNVAGAMYGYAETLQKNGKPYQPRWRAYFVDTKYSRATPPVIADRPNELIVKFVTGGDDLRGGNDNVHLSILLRTGRSIRFENINERKRWIDNSSQTVSRSLPATLRIEDVIGIRLETTFRGGIGGDNWNLNGIQVRVRMSGEDRTLLIREGKPLFRFTGDQRVREFRFTSE